MKCHLQTLDTKKACGYDNLPARLLRDAALYISSSLTYIFNLSIERGKFPDALKVAKVTPIYKKGRKDLAGNYRPISVLPILGKIFEKIINNRVIDYLEANNILFQHQYGFRKKHSTKLSLINLTNTLLKYIDEGRTTVGIFIDFQKAFDTINHSILLKKMSHYGIRGLALQWFEDYLCKRSQFIQYKDKMSLKLNITCGVPQGSVLGPTLFLLYINDLPNSTNFFNFRLFADDSNLFHTFNPRQKEIDLEIVSENLMKVQEWCNANEVTINLQKTNYMIMKSKARSIDKKGSVRISRSNIKEVSVASFVGIEIDCHLSWKEHIQTINKCIRKKVGILFKLRHFVPKNILVLLYKAFIQPHLSYGVEVWGSTYKSNLNCIYLSQKMAMRAITFSPLRTDSKALFQSLNILNIFQLHELLVSTFMYDLVKGFLPHSLVDYCQMIQHRYATRRKESGLLYQPKCKTTQGQFCISFVGTKLWNDLPDEIRLKTSRLSFRRHLSTYLLCK